MLRLLKAGLIRVGLVAVLLPLFVSSAMAVSPEREQELLGIWLEIRQIAAAKGDREAQYDLGVAYWFGRGAALDPAASYHWFKLASDQEHTGAHLYLGYFYHLGEYIPKNLERSRHHYKEAARLGDQGARVRVAQSYLGGGDGFPRDPAEAHFWFSLAGDSEGVERSARQLNQRQLVAATARARGIGD
jgi:TPR repeat protein